MATTKARFLLIDALEVALLFVASECGSHRFVFVAATSVVALVHPDSGAAPSFATLEAAGGFHPAVRTTFLPPTTV